jgi:hypothetical protein
MLGQSEHAAQLLVEKRECGRLQSPDRRPAQARTVEESRAVYQYGRGHLQAGVVRGKTEVQWSLRRRFGQGHNGSQRTLGFVVGIRRNDDYRPSRALFVPLNRIQSAPIDLPPLDYHSSPSKSRAVPWSQSSISAFWRADSRGSAAIRWKASPTSCQKIRSSICFRAVSITCALGWRSFADNLESTSMASPAMRTLVAMFSHVHNIPRLQLFGTVDAVSSVWKLGHEPRSGSGRRDPCGKIWPKADWQSGFGFISAGRVPTCGAVALRCG